MLHRFSLILVSFVIELIHLFNLIFISREHPFKRRIEPELKGKLCSAQLCIHKTAISEIEKELRSLLNDTPFNQNDPKNVTMTLKAWQGYIQYRFDAIVEVKTALEAWNTIFLELLSASRGSPTSQVHSIFALSGLITALWAHRRIHGISEGIENLAENALETIASIAFPDRSLDQRKFQILDWSHYKGKVSINDIILR